MKKLLVMLIVCACAVSAAAAQEDTVIGVCIYNTQDTFVSSLLEELKSRAQSGVRLLIRDAENDQNRQNDQVLELLDIGVDALIVNPVDRTTAVYLLRMAMRRDAPIVFINKEPLREDLALYEKAYYVGIDPSEQGLLCGRLAARYFTENPMADRNGDGALQLVIIRGEPGHQDAELRTVHSLRALQEAGIRVDKLREEAAMWERGLGQERMAAMLSSLGDKIECVISNNDDMALGAIDALKAAGYFAGSKYMPVIGVDATAPAREAVAQGSLYGTVINDAGGQGRAAIDLAVLLASGLEVTGENYSYEMIDKVVYIPSSAITADGGL